MRAATSQPRIRRFACDQRGAIAIEYLAVTVVALMTIGGFSAIAVELAGQYRRALTIVNSEYP